MADGCQKWDSCNEETRLVRLFEAHKLKPGFLTSHLVLCNIIKQREKRLNYVNIRKEKVTLNTFIWNLRLVSKKLIHEEIKSRLKPGNAYYHSKQNLLSSSLLSKN